MGVRARGLATGGLALLAVAGLIVAARRARLEPLLVRGDSMRPTLDPGQRIAVGPVRGALRRGEVVLLRRAGLEMVKRVVGLPGEHVRLLNGRLEVDRRSTAGSSSTCVSEGTSWPCSGTAAATRPTAAPLVRSPART